MIFTRFSLATIVAVLFLLPACGPQRKQNKRMPICTKTINYKETKNGITIKLHAIVPQELETIVRNSKPKLAQNGILPISLTVTNNSASSIKFSPFQKNIPFAQENKVRSALHGNKYDLVPVAIVLTAVLTAVTGFGALFYTSIAAYFGGISTLAMISIMVLPTGGVLLLGSGGSLLLHKKLDADYQKMSKAICNTKLVSLKPNEEFKALILLDANKMSSTFDMHIHNPTHEATIFTIPTIDTK